MWLEMTAGGDLVRPPSKAGPPSKLGQVSI